MTNKLVTTLVALVHLLALPTIVVNAGSLPVPASTEFDMRAREKSSRTSTRHGYRNIEDEKDRELASDDDSLTQRMAITPFFVVIEPTPELNQMMEEELAKRIREVTERYIQKKLKSSETNLKYVFWKVGSFDSKDKTTLELTSAFASFATNRQFDVPSTNDLDQWIQQAINTELISAPELTDFGSITKGTYISSVSAVNDIEDGPIETSKDKSGPILVIVVGASIAGLLSALLIILFCLRRRRLGNTMEIVHDGLHKSSKMKFDDFDITESESDQNSSKSMPRSMSACRSLGEVSGDSGWTVETEAGDSTALKSIPSTIPKLSIPPAMPPENFERDRQISVQKDMLTSLWSGRMPNLGAVHSDSVLAPSHFSASRDGELSRNKDPKCSRGLEFEQAHEGVSGERYLVSTEQDEKCFKSRSSEGFA